jgi:hypothetical protein
MGWLLTNPEKPYIDSSKTDVMRTWQRFGFVPPSQSKARESAGSKLNQQKEENHERL